MDVLEKAKKIRLIIFDVDGTLTTGTLFYGQQDIDIKGFHVHDGLGIKLLQQSGVNVGILSAKESKAVRRRIEDLGITLFYLGCSNKLPLYEKIKKDFKLNDDEIAFVGDDLPDLSILKRVGLAITVPHADPLIHQHSHMITTKASGNGAAREICDLIMKAKGTYDQAIANYLI